jgi:hypothetical protein
MKTYTTEELRAELSAMTKYMDSEVFEHREHQKWLVENESEDFCQPQEAWWVLGAQFVEWCVNHKGGVLLFEFLCDAGRADNDEMGRLLKAILEDNEGGE